MCWCWYRNRLIRIDATSTYHNAKPCAIRSSQTRGEEGCDVPVQSRCGGELRFGVQEKQVSSSEKSQWQRQTKLAQQTEVSAVGSNRSNLYLSPAIQQFYCDGLVIAELPFDPTNLRVLHLCKSRGDFLSPKFSWYIRNRPDN